MKSTFVLYMNTCYRMSSKDKKRRAVIKIHHLDLALRCSIRFDHRDKSCYGYS